MEKSTIAKLIYFFQRVPEKIYEYTTIHTKDEEYEEYIKPIHFQFPVINSFFSIFGTEHPRCNLEYKYNTENFGEVFLEPKFTAE